MKFLANAKAKVALFVGLMVVSGLASAVGTTLTALPAAAGTATDTLISASGDVSVILFGIGVPMVLAWVGFKVFKKAASKST